MSVINFLSSEKDAGPIFDDLVISEIASFLTQKDRGNFEIAALAQRSFEDTNKAFTKAYNADLSEKIEKAPFNTKEIAKEIKESLIPVDKANFIKSKKEIFGVHSINDKNFASYAVMKYAYEKNGFQAVFDMIKEMPEEIQDNAFAELVTLSKEKGESYEKAFNQIKDLRIRLHILHLIHDEDRFVFELQAQKEIDGINENVCFARLLKDIWKNQDWNAVKEQLDIIKSRCDEWGILFYTDQVASFLITAIHEEGSDADKAISDVIGYIDSLNDSEAIYKQLCQNLVDEDNTQDFQFVLHVISKLDLTIKEKVIPHLICYLSKENPIALPRFLRQVNSEDRIKAVDEVIKAKTIDTFFVLFYELVQLEDVNYICYFLTLLNTEDRNKHVERLFQDLIENEKWEALLNLLNAHPGYSTLGISLLAKELRNLEREGVPVEFGNFLEKTFPHVPLYRESSYYVSLVHDEYDPFRIFMYATQVRNKEQRSQILKQLIL